MEFIGKAGSLGKPARKKKRKTTELKKKTKVRTKFEEFLEMEMGRVGSGAVEDDIETERKLAKKLKVKGGKLGGDDDEMNELIGGIPSILDSTVIGSGVGGDAEKLKEEGVESVILSRKMKRQKKKTSSVSEHQMKQTVEEADDTFEQLDMSDKEGPCVKMPALDGKKASETKRKAKVEEITEVKESEAMKEREEVMPSKKREKKRKSSHDSMEPPEAGADANISWGTQQGSGVYEKIYEREKEPCAIAPSVDTGVKYIAPHLRAPASGESEELMQLRRRLRADDILLRGLTWSKLLDPQKKGQWWLYGEIASSSNVEEVMTTINREVLEAQNLVQLAAAQRMNTDIRRAIFCIIMSAEDYIDAFETILRLDISGKQDREVMRVIVECCLQEKMFNKYYTVLASKFCSHDKNHKFTLQFCIWDHFKELETMELHRSKNLARFVSEMLSAFTLSLSLLKTVDLADPAQLAPKRIMHFRMLFEAIFDNTDAVVWNIFTRAAAIPELEMLRSSFVFFIKQYVVAVNAQNSTLEKFKLAKKALYNVAGVLM